MEDSSDSDSGSIDFECDSECEYGADIHDPKDDSDLGLEVPLEAQSTSAKSGPSTSASTTADALKRSGLPPIDPKQCQSRHSIGHRQWALILYAQEELYFCITALTNITETTVRRLVVKAKLHRWDPADNVVQPFYVEDAPRSGRPKCSDIVIQHILNTMIKNSTTCGYSC
jgi:hypothetical protein